MGWSLGWDNRWKRDIGYGVPAWCDHPKCNAEIDRGLGYVCGGRPYGGDLGCGLYFCEAHLADHRWSESDSDWVNVCPRCRASKPPYKRIKADHPAWIRHKLTHESWAQWRAENETEVTTLQLVMMERGELIDIPEDVVHA